MSESALIHAPVRGLNLRRFFSASSVYAIGDLLTKSARFVLIPYYVQVLTKTEIGTLGVVQAISIASWTLFAFGFGFAIPRYYFDHKERADRFVAAMWWTRMGVTFIPCGLLVALCFVAGPAVMPQIPIHLVALSIVSGFLRAGFNVVEAGYMIREQPVKYRSFTFLQFVTTTVLIILLVSVANLGVAGVVIGELISFSLWTVISAFLVGAVKLPEIRQLEWKRIFRYCSSLLPHTLFMCALGYSDRIVLQRFVPLKDLGIYELAYVLASTLSVAALAMRGAWQPVYFRHANEERGRIEFARTASYFFAVVFFAAASLAILAPEGIWLVTSGGYDEAVLIMRVVTFGLVGHAIFLGINQPLLYEGKNALLSVASGSATVINVALNIWWIPKWGILGAAISTFVTYAALASFAFLLTRWYCPIRWERATLIGGFIAALTVGLIGCSLPTMPLVSTLIVKLSLIAVLLGIIAALLFRQRSTHLSHPSTHAA